MSQISITKHGGITYVQLNDPVDTKPGQCWYRPALKDGSTTIDSPKIYMALDTQGYGNSITEVTKAYVVGGYSGALFSSSERLDFSVNTSEEIASSLNTKRTNANGFSNKTTGYIAGGFNNRTASPYIKDIETLTFSNESVSTLTASLLSVCHEGGASFESHENGYISSGTNDEGSFTKIVDKVSFTGSISQNITSSLYNRTYKPSGFSSKSSGYIVGSIEPGEEETIEYLEKMNFITESMINTSKSLNVRKTTSRAIESKTHAYVVGFDIEKMSFSTETFEKISSSPDNYIALFAEIKSNTSGYICGGLNALSNVSLDQISRLNFYNDSIQTYDEDFKLTQTRYNAVGLENITQYN